jgi:hypothetical protein
MVSPLKKTRTRRRKVAEAVEKRPEEEAQPAPETVTENA